MQNVKRKGIMGAVVHTGDPNTQEIETARLEVQGHPQVLSEFKCTLDNLRACLNEKRRRRKRELKAFSWKVEKETWIITNSWEIV